MNHGPEEDRAGKENNTSLSICPLFLFSVFLLLLCASSLTLHPLPVPPLHKPSPSLISRPFVMLRKPPGLTLVYCLLSMRMQLCIHHGLYFLFVFFCLSVSFSALQIFMSYHFYQDGHFLSHSLFLSSPPSPPQKKNYSLCNVFCPFFFSPLLLQLFYHFC